MHAPPSAHTAPLSLRPTRLMHASSHTGASRALAACASQWRRACGAPFMARQAALTNRHARQSPLLAWTYTLTVVPVLVVECCQLHHGWSATRPSHQRSQAGAAPGRRGAHRKQRAYACMPLLHLSPCADLRNARSPPEHLPPSASLQAPCFRASLRGESSDPTTRSSFITCVMHVSNVEVRGNGALQPLPSCLVVRPFVVALPTDWSFVCPGAAPCAYSCFAHIRPCAQGRCGRCLL